MACEGLRSGDLIFQVEGISDFSKAISEATAPADSLKLVHVALIEVTQDSVNVIEADPQNGVRCTPLKDFLTHNPAVIVKRLNIDFPVSLVIENAKKHLGEPYDWSYYPDNGKMYCSELIYDSYINFDGTKIFEAQPMNFLAPDGSMPKFWEDLFNDLGEPVPQGLPGSNPNDLSKDERLVTVSF